MDYYEEVTKATCKKMQSIKDRHFPPASRLRRPLMFLTLHIVTNRYHGPAKSVK